MQLYLSLLAMLVMIDNKIGTRLLRLPLVTCSIVGALLGNLTTGILVGASLQVFYYSYGLDGSEMSIYGVVATIYTITQNIDASAISYSIGISFAVGLSALSSLIGSFFLIPARKAIETQNIKKLGLYNILPLLLSGVLAFAFVYVMYGNVDTLETWFTTIKSNVKWVWNGIVMASFMLRFLGIAVLLRNLQVKNFIPSLLAGASLGIASIGIQSYMMIPCTLIGIALAIYSFKQENKQVDEISSNSTKKGAEKWW